MDSYFHIEGVPPYDGDYPLDIGALTNKELHTIKTISGVRAGELEEALAAGDNDLVIAFVAVALARAGKHVDMDVLWNAPAGQVELRVGEGAEEGPPARTPPAANGDGGANTESSGADGSNVGDSPPPNDPNSTGPLPSDTSAASVRLTSVT